MQLLAKTVSFYFVTQFYCLQAQTKTVLASRLAAGVPLRFKSTAAVTVRFPVDFNHESSHRSNFSVLESKRSSESADSGEARAGKENTH